MSTPQGFPTNHIDFAPIAINSPVAMFLQHRARGVPSSPKHHRLPLPSDAIKAHMIQHLERHNHLHLHQHESSASSTTASAVLRSHMPKQYREGPDGTFLGTFRFIFALVPYALDLESDVFERERLAEFRGGDAAALGKTLEEVRLDFFDNAKRNLLVYMIAQRCKIHQHNGRIYNIGINHLLLEQTYTDFFAVHDGPYWISRSTAKEPTPPAPASPSASTFTTPFTPMFMVTPSCPPPPKNPHKENQRAWLYQNWARFRLSKGHVLLEQPLRQIRDYFGERVAYYFTWLGFYSLWLWIPSLVGILVFVYGLLTRKRIQDVFDNALTTPFAFFMAVWAALFLEFWKRQEYTLNTIWDVNDMETVETKRPEWYGTHLRRSPVTGKIEMFWPRRVEAIVRAFTTIILGGAILLMVGFEVVVVLTHAAALKLPVTVISPTNVASLVAGVMTLVNIIFLTPVYLKLSHTLTLWENHKTLERFDNSLIYKSFIVSFVNNYSTLTYVGFIKVFVGYKLPAIGLVSDSCDVFLDDDTNSPYGSCMSQLMLNMLVIFVGLQFFNQLRLVLTPLFRQYVRRYLRGRGGADSEYQRSPRIRKRSGDDTAAPPRSTSYVPQYAQDDILDTWHQKNEFTSKMVQFGFVSLFSCGFPLAPFFALLNNAVEIRFGAFRLVAESRRPFVSRVQGIGAWKDIANGIARVGVLFNALTIAFSSGYFEGVYLKNVGVEYKLGARVAFVLIFENLVFLMVFLIDWLVPDVPGKVRHALERQKYLKRIESGQEIEDEDAVDENDLGIKTE
ncbi:Anoctamin-7 [Phlyctochytrium planicorne]|nr:Anoctamin-7 [Phlyctochytrium planicorne]